MSEDLRILDVGAGDGFFAKSLLKEFGGSANCIDTGYEHDFSEDSIFFSKCQQIQNPNVFLFIDVLEHVTNPTELLSRHLESSSGKAILVISVPAFRILWSPHDEFLGHIDRYQIKQILKWLELSGINFKIYRRHYLFSLLFLPVFLYRLFRRGKRSDLKKHSRMTNSLLRYLSNFDNLRIRNRFFGLSAYVVAVINTLEL